MPFDQYGARSGLPQITNQLWVVESNWSVEIQLKVTSDGPFSCRALALPFFSLARKWYGFISLLLNCSKQSCSLAAAVALPTCMHLSICSHVHVKAYSVLRPMQSAGPSPPRHQHLYVCNLHFSKVAKNQALANAVQAECDNISNLIVLDI